MTIQIFDKNTNNYIDELYLSEISSKKEIEKNIKELYNINEIYYSIL